MTLLDDTEIKKTLTRLEAVADELARRQSEATVGFAKDKFFGRACRMFYFGGINEFELIESDIKKREGDSLSQRGKYDRSRVIGFERTGRRDSGDC